MSEFLMSESASRWSAAACACSPCSPGIPRPWTTCCSTRRRRRRRWSSARSPKPGKCRISCSTTAATARSCSSGERRCGGKQNRVFASSMLVAGRNGTRVPVCCVEAGRWGCGSRKFASGSCSSPSIRHALQAGENARQARVWTTICERHRRLGIRSPTGNMSNALDVRREAAEEMRRSLPYAEGASGIAAALGGKIVGIDVFDQPVTMAKLWDRLVQGLVLDAAATPDTARLATASDVAVKLYALKNMSWQKVDSVGLGDSYRGSDDDVLATALVAGGGLIHLGASMPT